MGSSDVTGRRWAYVGAFLGGAVSIAANVAHSYVPPDRAPAGWTPHAGAVVGAVFWPVALLVAVEIMARVDWPVGRRWVAVRWFGLLPVAVVAAVVSYRHLSGLLAFYGEDPLTVTVGPLAVDGLMVMATGALIATSRRTAIGDVSVPVPNDKINSVDHAVGRESATLSNPASGLPKPADPGTPNGTPRKRSAKATGRATDSATKVARAHAKNPAATHAEIARKTSLGVRTVARHRPAKPDATEPDTTPVNGSPRPPESTDQAPVNGRVPDLTTTT